MNKPNIVYKYMGLNDVGRIQTLLVESKLYCAKPSQFNDPFEFKPKRMSFDTPEIEEELAKRHIDPTLDAIYDSICKELDKFGVCCFSEKFDDILMWSHYSEKHTGVCLGFGTNNDFFKNLVKVDYEPDRHDIDIKNWQQEDFLKVMRRKLESWNYEGEWRLIMKPGGKLVEFPSEILNSIIFGACCPEPRKKLIKTLLHDRNIDYYCAEINKFIYRLNIFPCM